MLPTPSEFDFVCPFLGVHVSTLFGLAPVNDIAHVYGYLSINNNQLNGVIRLDALCDYTALQDLIRVIQGNEDAILNNLINSLRFDVVLCLGLHRRERLKERVGWKYAMGLGSVM